MAAYFLLRIATASARKEVESHPKFNMGHFRVIKQQENFLFALDFGNFYKPYPKISMATVPPGKLSLSLVWVK